MKKICRFFVVVLGLLILFSAFSTPALAANTEDINYTISYSNTIYCSAEYIEFYDVNPYRFNHHKETVEYEITDLSAVSSVAEFKKSSLNYLNNTKWYSGDYSVRVVYVTNGTDYNIQSNEEEVFLKFFELPSAFVGTKEIVKEDIRFKVTRNNEKFFFSVITNIKDIKRKSFEVPPVIETTTEENIEYEVYNVSYWNKDTGFMAQGQEKSLQAALECCAQKADLTKDIRIFVQKTYRLKIFGKSLGGTILEINYGNVGGGTTQTSSTQQSTSQQGPSAQQNTTSSNQTSTQSVSSAVSEAPQPDTKNESNFISESETDVNTDTSKKTQKGSSKTAIICIATILVATLIGGGVFLLIKICYKKKSK